MIAVDVPQDPCPSPLPTHTQYPSLLSCRPPFPASLPRGRRPRVHHPARTARQSGLRICLSLPTARRRNLSTVQRECSSQYNHGLSLSKYALRTATSRAVRSTVDRCTQSIHSRKPDCSTFTPSTPTCFLLLASSSSSCHSCAPYSLSPSCPRLRPLRLAFHSRSHPPLSSTYITSAHTWTRVDEIAIPTPPRLHLP